MSQMSFIKDNPSAPPVRFVRIRGRIVPISGSKKVPKAGPMVSDRLVEMNHEVKQAEFSGRSFSAENGRNFGGFSTYPKFYKDIGFRNKDDFQKTFVKQEGKKFDALTKQAINDLLRGYETSHGRVPPNQDFRVLTRQSFNNKGVVFRRIGGKVRPIKFTNPRDDEVPF